MGGKRKIIFSVTNDLRYDQRMQRICTTLSDAGFDITLVGRRYADSPSLPEYPFATKRMRLLFRKGKMFYAEYMLRLFCFLLFHRADIYGAVDLDSILPQALVAKIKGKPLVYDAHEYFTEVPELEGREREKRIWDRIARFAIPKASLCYTVGPELARELGMRYGKEFLVLRNVPFSKTITGDSQPERLILYQGALNEGRGLEELIRAMQHLDLKLCLIGEGDKSRSLRELVAQLKLEDKVEFKGFVPPEQLIEWTQSAWLGYNVLEHKGQSYYYSLANKTFDYIMAEVPVICSPFPEYEALASEHPAIIFAMAQEAELSERIQNLLNDEKLYLQLKQACKAAKKDWNWERESERLPNWYEQV